VDYVFCRSLRICDFLINHKNLRVFVICGVARDLRIYDSGRVPRICGFAICGLLKKFACPPLLFGHSGQRKYIKDNLYRLHTAFLHWPLSSAATKEVQGPDTT
jgi:hypothetical protein